MRKMASVQRVGSISPIPNADAIEVISIGGWKVVSKKGIHSVGNLVVFCEVDSWIPHELAPFLSSSSGPKEYLGVAGNRLRTVKLRGQLSQGLIFPLSELPLEDVEEGEDVSERLGIVKWEPPVPAQLAGVVRCPFPSFIPKTDQERVQNLREELYKWSEKGYTFEVSEKLDGSSCTVFMRDGDLHVCSRNLDLEYNLDNSFWGAVAKQNLIKLWTELGISDRFALQGELIGEGIQGNPYKVGGRMFMLFDIYDIKGGGYLLPRTRLNMMSDIFSNAPSDVVLWHVPVISTGFSMLTEVDEWLNMADGNSLVCHQAKREGLVMKCEQNTDISFKAISNKWLLKNGG